jgi:hypothetical protein
LTHSPPGTSTPRKRHVRIVATGSITSTAPQPTSSRRLATCTRTNTADASRNRTASFLPGSTGSGVRRHAPHHPLHPVTRAATQVAALAAANPGNRGGFVGPGTVFVPATFRQESPMRKLPLATPRADTGARRLLPALTGC